VRSVLALLLIGCSIGAVVVGLSADSTLTQKPHGKGPRPAQTQSLARLRVDGARLVDADGRRFDWRGITAFRLLEFIAHGRERDAIAFLDWASSQKLTVVRVFVMAHHLFQLKPQEGIASLPRLLELAAARRLYVEVVALADTAEIALDLDQQVKAVGAIAAAHANALVEIANEPWHPTQDKRLHDPVLVKRLAGLIPPSVPVALGSAEGDPRYAEAGYATWHSPRASGDDGWRHVTALSQGAKLMADWKKPVISDEPIGAADVVIPGRRDNAPGRFAAAGALTGLAGLGATFHYEGGLQAKIPAGRENDCFIAWRNGLALLDDLPEGGAFVVADGLAKVAAVRDARAVFGRVYAREAWIVAIDPREKTSVAWGDGWRGHSSRRADGVIVFRSQR
jgi:hypothetical protein